MQKPKRLLSTASLITLQNALDCYFENIGQHQDELTEKEIQSYRRAITRAENEILKLNK